MAPRTRAKISKNCGDTARTSSKCRIAGPISFTDASNKGWNSIGSSVTNIPSAANIATRPCWSSASRYCLMVSKSLPSVKPNGSKFPTGSKAPGKPYANALASGVKTGASPETVAGRTVRRARVAVEKVMVDMGKKKGKKKKKKALATNYMALMLDG